MKIYVVRGSQEQGMDKATAIVAILNELNRAQQIHPPMNSHHEGFAVIKEEIDELWDAIKANNEEAAMEEVMQVGAMCLRFMIDCWGKEIS